MQRSGAQAQAATTHFIPAQRTHAARCPCGPVLGQMAVTFGMLSKAQGKTHAPTTEHATLQLNAVQVQI